MAYDNLCTASWLAHSSSSLELIYTARCSGNGSPNAHILKRDERTQTAKVERPPSLPGSVWEHAPGPSHFRRPTSVPSARPLPCLDPASRAAPRARACTPCTQYIYRGGTDAMLPLFVSLFNLGPGRLAHPFTLTFVMALAYPTPAYNIHRDYSGASFFDGWDFYGSWDNLTLSEYFLA